MGNQPVYPPHPTVEHLTTLFRRVQVGDIVVPAFQRAFVWGAGEMLSLLESVNAGYPIGSLLIWKADEKVLRLNEAKDIPFPVPDFKLPVHYILDGLQRLSTLYGAFHYEPGVHDSNFDIRYDLEAERFVRGGDAIDLRPTIIPMSALFKPKRMIEIQRDLIASQTADDALDRLTDLQARFQEYMIPVVTLGQRDLDEVVSIFERVNSTGTRLSRVDFMRAVTWSKNFDLNDAILNVKSSIEDESFEVDDDTIVKGLGLIFGLDPVPDALTKLRRENPSELKAALPILSGGLREVFRFLRKEVGIYSEQFVPYEGQILVLLSVFLRAEAIDEQVASFLRSWFMKGSFEEALQGRPDHFVANMIWRVLDKIEKRDFSLDSLNFESSKFVRRRMLKGKAFTSAVYVMLARRNPIDLITGQEIFPFQITSGYDPKSIMPIFDVATVEKFSGSRLSVKFPANVVISNASIQHYDTSYLRDWILNLSGSEGGLSMLETHLINEEMCHALRQGDAGRFLELRSSAMFQLANELIY